MNFKPTIKYFCLLAKWLDERQSGGEGRSPLQKHLGFWGDPVFILPISLTKKLHYNTIKTGEMRFFHF